MTSNMASKHQKMFRLVVFSLFLFFQCTVARKHHLRLERDKRPVITMSSFGFLKKGVLLVNVTDLSVPSPNKHSNQTVGFTVGVSKSSGAEAYMEEFPDKCKLKYGVDQGGTDEDVKKQDFSIVFFRIDFRHKRVEIERKGSALQKLIIGNNCTVDEFRASLIKGGNCYTPKGDNSKARRRRATFDPVPKAGILDVNPKNVTSTVTVTTAMPSVIGEPGVVSKKTKEGANAEPVPKAGIQDGGNGDGKEKEDASTEKGNAGQEKTPSGPLMLKRVPLIKKTDTDSYSFNFLVAVTQTEEEGMYSLDFHNCISDMIPGENEISLTLDIVEDNDGNYLSAGAMPLPTLYFVLSVTYIIVAVIWNTVLCKSEDAVYKMHYLMLVVVFVKSLSCLFHAVNYHFIMKEGIHEEAWAVLYYIAYLTRGALLFVTIILIGSGWAFIKHVLSDREKKLFLIFIPLQILDNIARIIVEESEEGQSQYTVWKEIFILIDLLCCGAILFPVVWSIKHLQEASKANGKELLSLTKLKLFRQFYIMVVCYIYFTRIIVYLLKLTVPFKYEWLDELFREMATIMFFVVTGYKFRPATDNPYLQVPSDDEEDMEMDTVIVGESANLETVKKVNQGLKEETTGVKLRESSHEYD